MRRIVLLIACVTLFLQSCKQDAGIPASEENNSSQASQQDKNLLHPDVQNGTYTERYPDGKLKMQGTMLNGKKEGLWMAYYNDGSLWSEGYFKAGNREGNCAVYYPNGRMRYKGQHRNNQATGKWVFYNEQGQQVNEQVYP